MPHWPGRASSSPIDLKKRREIYQENWGRGGKEHASTRGLDAVQNRGIFSARHIASAGPQAANSHPQNSAERVFQIALAIVLRQIAAPQYTRVGETMAVA